MNILKIEKSDLSKEVLDIIMNNKGYRSEVPYGSGVRNLDEVITFEINELGNTDIVTFCNDIYKLNLDFRCNLSEDTEDYFEELDSKIQDDYLFYSKKIIEFIAQQFNCKPCNLSAVWLATKEAVADFYCKDYIDKNIDEYILPSKYLIISDLGFDGALIAYTEQPTINENIY